MKCSCDIEARVAMGKPLQQDGKTYWHQTFTCQNDKCSHFGKVIAERMVNIFDEKDQRVISHIE